ncbi:MAG TPA: hypothetical protein VLS93_15690, partial [Anaeromyxobacteraceae bacterium]|nr:hypothetical protein [Anaeromyxobacteraceae bacterium]
LGLGLGLVALVAMGAKPYYLGPAFPTLFAAGAAAAERGLRRPWARGALLAAPALAGAPAIPIAIPLLSPAALAAWQARLGVAPPRLERMEYGALPQHFADQFGWEERVRAVAEAWKALPEDDRRRAFVYTTNYGRAAAADLLGPRHGLPGASSGHNNYFLWGVPDGRDVVLAWGGREADYREEFAEVIRVGETPAVDWGLPYESNVPIFVLRGPRRPLPEIWSGAKRYL